MIIKRTNTFDALLIFICLTASSVLSQTTNLVINEILTSNAHVINDPDFKNYTDWIELHNNGNSIINLNGFSITDNLNDKTKFIIEENIDIQPGGYLLIWADNQDTALHTNFALSKDGGSIAIFDRMGNTIDIISYPYQIADVSYGRTSENSNNWEFYFNPTPNYPNNSTEYSTLERLKPPDFSIEGGFYTSGFFLELLTSEGTEIRYTLDGSEPDRNSLQYINPISISDRIGEPNVISEIPTNEFPVYWLPEWQPPLGEVQKATVIRARAYGSGILPSEIATRTFFVGEEVSEKYKEVPVISLVTDNKYLFDDDIGIYVPGANFEGIKGTANYNQRWLRPANIEYFEMGGNLGFNQEFEIKIQGNSSTTSPQKSIQVTARNKYGNNFLNYPLFKNSKHRANKIPEFKHFIIHAWGGQWDAGMINDAFSQLSYTNSTLDFQDYYPVILFINGEYWGLQAVREANKNPYYFQNHYGINVDDPGVDILYALTGLVDEGDNKHWEEMVAFLEQNDITQDENYNIVKSMMDVNNFIEYIGHCVYFDKADWPGANEHYWRPRTANGRWKWIQYDMDMTLTSIYNNEIQNILDSEKTKTKVHPIAARLIKNQEFKNNFINWFMDRMNADFKPDVLIKLLHEMLNNLYKHMEEHQHRWALNPDLLHKRTALNRIFINERPAYKIAHIKSYFKIDSTAKIIIDRNNSNGRIKINTLTIDENTPGVNDKPYPWIGQYFEEIPVSLTAIPNTGYQFHHWQINNDSTLKSSVIELFLNKETTIEAVFGKQDTVKSIYINELCAYNDDLIKNEFGEQNDWIELFNAGNRTVDLSKLYLTNDFTQPLKWRFEVRPDSQTYINPGEYKIVWCHDDTKETESLRTNFSLNDDGEQLGISQIVADDTIFIDSLTFPEQFLNISFGRIPDGTGEFEYLTVPSPGFSNIDATISTDELKKYRLFQNYPNPFSHHTNIEFFLPDLTNIELIIFNLLGAKVRSLINGEEAIGYNKILWNGKDDAGKQIPSGVYFYQLRINNKQISKKLLYIK